MDLFSKFGEMNKLFVHHTGMYGMAEFSDVR